MALLETQIWKGSTAKTSISVEEASSIVMNHVLPLKAIELETGQSLSYVLAQDIYAPCDVPRFNRSMMDGFALRSRDVKGASNTSPVALHIVDHLPAGVEPTKVIREGEAARIMTGGMIPLGADSVVRLESTVESLPGDMKKVLFLKEARTGENIALQGEDMAAGDFVIAKGTRIGAAEIAVLVTLGYVKVRVYPKPRVAIMATGSELVDFTEEPIGAQIRDSNTPTLTALVEQFGGEAIVVKPHKDETLSIAEALTNISSHVDLIVTTGGVSVGDYDLIPEVYSHLQAEQCITKVKMRPGSPFRMAVKDHKPYFGLSGNVAASFVNFLIFVLPALRKMSGCAEPSPLQISKAKFTKGKSMNEMESTRFLRGTAWINQGIVEVDMAEGQSSGMLGSFVGSNCLICVHPFHNLHQGDLVDILLIDALNIRPI